jgi:hypothetical protein
MGQQGGDWRGGGGAGGQAEDGGERGGEESVHSASGLWSFKVSARIRVRRRG